MLTETNVTRDIEEIRESAESLDAAKTERIATASAGDVVRQGDLYLVCLADAPAGTPTKDRQLTPGTTQGSRHVASGKCSISLADDPAAVAATVNRLVKGASVPAELIGPVIRCRGDVTITHPEHGHRVLPAGSIWATVYQRAYAEDIRRVQD